MSKLAEIDNVVKKFQEHSGSNEVPNFDFQLVRFGPKKSYWYYSYSYDSWHEIILNSWNGDFEEARFNTSNKTEQDTREIREKVRNLIDQENNIIRENASNHAKEYLPKLSEGKHPYIDKKKVKSYGVFVDKTFLIIPVRNKEEIVGLQRISSNGDKTFLEGTMMSASYHALMPFKDASIVHLSEGYATAATIQEAFPDIPSIMAFNANNLPKVAKYIREVNPSCEIVIFADKDTVNKLGYRTGEHYAEIACKQVSNCRYVLPDSGVFDKYDFNDLGFEATREQFKQEEVKEVEFKNDFYKSVKLPNFNGFAEYFFKYIYKTSPVKRTRFAAAATISALGSVMSNKFFVGNQTTNFYTMIVGHSASGKDRPVQCVKNLFGSIKRIDRVMGTPSSSWAIYDMLSPPDIKGLAQRTEYPCLMITSGEAEQLIKSMSDKKNSFGQSINTVLLELYTSTKGEFLGSTTKGGVRRGNCFSPAVNFIGSMTIEGFQEAVDNKSIGSGLAGRFLFFPDSEAKMPEMPACYDYEKTLLDWCTSIIDMEGIIELKLTDDAKELYNSKCSNCFQVNINNTSYSSIMANRVREMVIKLAIFNRVCREIKVAEFKNKENRFITIDDISWASKFFEAQSNSIASFLNDNVSTGSNDRVTMTIQNVIKSFGGNGISKSDFYRTTEIRSLNKKSQELEKELSSLESRGDIFLVKKKLNESRKSSTVYVFKDYIK